MANPERGGWVEKNLDRGGTSSLVIGFGMAVLGFEIGVPIAIAGALALTGSKYLENRKKSNFKYAR